MPSRSRPTGVTGTHRGQCAVAAVVVAATAWPIVFLLLGSVARAAPTTSTLEPAADSGNNGTSTAAVPVGPVATTTTTADAAVANVSSADVGFSCEGRIFGYYGDPGNCSLFHYCEPFADPENNQFVLHAAYLCPNDTVFNQLSLTCAYAHEALPCRRAPEYYYINSHVVPADTQDSQSTTDSGSSGSNSSTAAPDTASSQTTTTAAPGDQAATS